MSAIQVGTAMTTPLLQGGHADPALTLRAYAHAMREEENDLSFGEFGSGSKRLYPAPGSESATDESRSYADYMARREGFASERSSR